MDKLALEPQCGGGVVEMRARDKTLAHRTFGQPLIEARQTILRGDERPRKLAPRDRIGRIKVKKSHRASFRPSPCRCQLKFLGKNRRTRSRAAASLS
ncbi:hypothetical protein MesoLj113b_71150 (plasmid) [Mesorhizobium sp. 113-3-3]|nr:hypothetical protein MesoLj113b_71150 [Mesorhizobium sp. 113-3-3]